MSAEDFVKAAQIGNIEKIRSVVLKDKSVVNRSVNIMVTLPNGDSLFVEGTTALHEAAANGHVEVLDFLLRNNANIEQKTAKGWTALHAATFNKQAGAALFLASRGANIAVKDEDDFTPIDGAYTQGLGYLVKDLETSYQKNHTELTGRDAYTGEE